MRRKPLTEKRWQQQVVAIARLHGWRSFHPYRSDRSVPGWPDLTLTHVEHGILFAELKTEKGRLTDHQREYGAHLAACGLRWFVWRPGDVDEVTAVLRGGA